MRHRGPTVNPPAAARDRPAPGAPFAFGAAGPPKRPRQVARADAFRAGVYERGTRVRELTETTLAGRYELQSLLGRGGMSSVYRARDLALDRPVAVKIMSDELLQQPTMRARFEREARAAARIAHPNVAHIYDFGTDGDTAFIAMEHVSGRSLRRMLEARGRLTLPEALEIAQQVGEALSAAHRLGILHRDVKPENILVCDEPSGARVKVVDFGLAKLLADSSGSQLTGGAEILGTPIYMAPERFTGGDVDERADVYALGVVRFEMLAGRAPFDGTVTEIIGKHVYAPPPELASFYVDVPESVAGAVARAMSKAPADRQASVDEFVSELGARRAVNDTRKVITRMTSALDGPPWEYEHDAPTYTGAEGSPTRFASDAGDEPTRVRPVAMPTVVVPRRLRTAVGVAERKKARVTAPLRTTAKLGRDRAVRVGAAAALALGGLLAVVLLVPGINGPEPGAGAVPAGSHYRAPEAAAPRPKGTVKIPEDGRQRLILGVDAGRVRRGAVLEITDAELGRTESFRLRKGRGDVWSLADTTRSRPGGLTLDDVLRPGATCSLLVRNTDGTTFTPAVSVEPSPPESR